MGGSARQAEVQQSQTLPIPAPHFPGQDPRAEGSDPTAWFWDSLQAGSCGVLVMAPISSSCATFSHWAQPAPSPSAPAQDPLTIPTLCCASVSPVTLLPSCLSWVTGGNKGATRALPVLPNYPDEINSAPLWSNPGLKHYQGSWRA